MTQTPIRARPGPVSEAVVHDPPDPRRDRFEEFFEANRDAVLGYLLRRTGSGHDAADLLADTFLIAWRRLDEVPGDQEGVLAETTQPEHLPGDSAAARAFRELPAQDQELLSLVAWEELDTAQIATTLGCSRNAVRIRLHRARKRFARLLTQRSPATVRGEVSHEDA